MQVFDEIANLTRNIKIYPYSPAPWLRRGRLLVHAGYPDLGAGDLRKAAKLLRMMHSTSRNPLQYLVRKQVMVSSQSLADGLPVLSEIVLPEVTRVPEAVWDELVQTLDWENYEVICEAMNGLLSFYDIHESCKGMPTPMCDEENSATAPTLFCACR